MKPAHIIISDHHHIQVLNSAANGQQYTMRLWPPVELLTVLHLVNAVTDQIQTQFDDFITHNDKRLSHWHNFASSINDSSFWASSLPVMYILSINTIEWIINSNEKLVNGKFKYHMTTSGERRSPTVTPTRVSASHRLSVFSPNKDN